MPDLPTAGAPANKYTYDLEIADGGPHKPDLAELGGDDFRDKVGSPPHKGRDPYAGLFNEHGRNLAGLNRMTETAILYISWNGTEWSLDALSAMGTKVDSDSFVLNPDATGQLSIDWDGGVLPPMEHEPFVTVTGSFGRAYGATTGPNGVVIHMQNSSGSAANVNVRVAIG